MMKKLLEILSGKPKNGSILESVKPYIFIPQLILSLLLLFVSIREQNFLIGCIAILFAWQMGWGMSITRYFVGEEKKNEKK